MPMHKDHFILAQKTSVFKAFRLFLLHFYLDNSIYQAACDHIHPQGIGM